MTIYGFNEQQVAEALDRFVKAGGVDRVLSSQSSPGRKPATRQLWCFTPKTAITAASGGEAGVDYTVGSGEAYVLELDRETLVLGKLENSKGNWVSKTLYNHHETALPNDTSLVFFGVQDHRGNFWVADIEDSGITDTGTGTGSDCVTDVAGIRLLDLPTETAYASYALGIDSSGCMCKIPIAECD